MREPHTLQQVVRIQSEIATGALDLTEAVDLVLDRARELTGAAGAVLAVADDRGLEGWARSGETDGLLERLEALGEGTSPLQSESLISLPLVHRDSPLGLLVLGAGPGGFDADDAFAMELVVDVIAAHLHNAERFVLEAHRSRHDALTELPNRRAYEERLPVEVARACRGGHPLALCLLDLDGFKTVNDTLGHPAGDAVLRNVAAAIRHCRLSDDVFRIGGDEFAILIPDAGRPEAEEAMERLIDSIVPGVDFPAFGVSFGIGCEGSTPRELHAAADRDLAAAKHRLYPRGAPRRGAVALRAA
jgi:diguanylate cyclase